MWIYREIKIAKNNAHQHQALEKNLRKGPTEKINNKVHMGMR